MEDAVKDKDVRRDVAAALRYDSSRDSAPVVVAAGTGRMAQKIVEVARREGVPLYQDSELAKTLCDLGIGVEIPPRLYEAVAKVLVFVARLDEKSGL